MLARSQGRVQWNYLRVRGEYHGHSLQPLCLAELPPRARRILLAVLLHTRTEGTTSACAENTTRVLPHTLASRNYLRVRGEYWMRGKPILKNEELPPRARRIPFCSAFSNPFAGTTSACAENTSTQTVTAGHDWNYLRVRGEYPHPRNGWSVREELPPRARRIHSISHVAKSQVGTTSACAENTGP